MTLQDLGYGLQADWLEENLDSYNEILIHEFSQWLHANPRPFRESVAQRVARETRLELIED
ncbi:hypothetical protein H6G64_33325 [Calothrix sp. FACHB-156]|nr:hypothetical protein [Calothrix sp. FACHB-156]